MSTDVILRSLAVAAAVALMAAPYWRVVALALQAGVEWGREHAQTLARAAAATLIVAAAWGKIPMPTLPAVPVVPAVVVPEPAPEMRRLVEPVAVAIGRLSPADRALWAATWLKAAVVVEAEAGTTVAVFTDTPALRSFTEIALDVAWRRIGGHRPGSVDGLREAVETAMRGALGLDEVPVTPHVRGRYAEVARAIAWAGTGD
jgi:hypothetical protein